MFERRKTQHRAKTHRPSKSAFSAIFVLTENGTQSHSAKFLNWDDHVNLVPDLAASPPWFNVARRESIERGSILFLLNKKITFVDQHNLYSEDTLGTKKSVP